jgi:hypothetical protein
MIIHHPEIIQRDGNTIIWARIESDRNQKHLPDYLWYKIPDQYAKYISLHGDAFLMPALLAAMHYDEALQVRSPISPKLAYHLDEYQFVMNYWMPKDVRPVAVDIETLSPLKENPQAVGCSFSSGVDSWFTIWNHIPQNQPIKTYQLTHALFINLFDITSKDAKKYDRLYQRYQHELRELGIDLIPLETNLVSIIIPRLKYTFFFAPVLAGSAMILGGLFKRFYVASGRDHRKLRQRSSSSTPLMAKLMSSDSLDFIQFGATHRRFEKIEAISDWRPVQRNLRVCGIPALDLKVLNCSRCEKCSRTMVPLYALGKLDNFTTFAKPFTNNIDTLWWARKFNPSQVSLTALLNFVHQHKPNLLPWLWFAAILGTIRYHIIKRVPEKIKPSLQSFGFYIDQFKEEGAFDNPQINKLIRDSEMSGFTK